MVTADHGFSPPGLLEDPKTPTAPVLAFNSTIPGVLSTGITQTRKGETVSTP